LARPLAAARWERRLGPPEPKAALAEPAPLEPQLRAQPRMQPRLQANQQKLWQEQRPVGWRRPDEPERCCLPPTGERPRHPPEACRRSQESQPAGEPRCEPAAGAMVRSGAAPVASQLMRGTQRPPVRLRWSVSARETLAGPGAPPGTSLRRPEAYGARPRRPPASAAAVRPSRRPRHSSVRGSREARRRASRHATNRTGAWLLRRRERLRHGSRS
jgi:hypothetical protein